MNNFVYIKNYENNSETIIPKELFKKLRYMFSDNSSFKYISHDKVDEMESLK